MYSLTITATGEETIHRDLGEAFTAAAKATGIARHDVTQSGEWSQSTGDFVGGYEDDGSDGFVIRMGIFAS